MAKQKSSTPVFTVIACGQGYDEPQVIATTTDRQRAIDRADATLRSWLTSHSVLSEPEVWVEDTDGIKVYEAWITRRRVRHSASGKVCVETPIQLWRDELDAWRDGRQEDAPFPFGHLMFERPEKYGCEALEPLANPSIVR